MGYTKQGNPWHNTSRSQTDTAGKGHPIGLQEVLRGLKDYERVFSSALPGTMSTIV